jgi:hypothetical protein
MKVVVPAGWVTVNAVPASTLYSVNDGPGYAAGLEPVSMMAVAMVPVTAGNAAGAPGPVNEPRPSVSLKPGFNWVATELAAHSTAVADAITVTLRKVAPHVGEPEKVQPVGAEKVMAVMA